MAYALKADETRDHDLSSLSAYIARGADVKAVADHLVGEGAVASFQRALDDATAMAGYDDDVADDADLEDVAVLSDDELRAGITSLAEWAQKVNNRDV